MFVCRLLDVGAASVSCYIRRCSSVFSRILRNRSYSSGAVGYVVLRGYNSR